MAFRWEMLRQIESTIYDVCVIGGGATGAGCALDAQLRGLRTVLIEGGDFASHTSSASTKMAHGGIRYLQAAVSNLDWRQYRLVNHALEERALMLRNAPHLASVQEFLVPCFRAPERLYYGAGLKMYDWLAGSGGIARSRVLGAAEASGRVPALRRSSLKGAVSYADGRFDDARYGLALVLTFRRAGGSALNYARVTAFERVGERRIAAAAVKDQISDGSFTVRARAFVNATGPFSDSVRRMASGDGSAERLRPSKGVHLLFPLTGWRDDGLVVPKTEDGRVIFALPYRGRLLVGTTDTPAPPDAPMVVTREEVAYLLRQINPYLAEPLDASGIVSGFAGLRPLVRSHGTDDTSKLIRDDEVEVDATSGLISILGGKWTTYRRMAEKTIDRVQEALGLAVGGCVTRSTVLEGSQGFHADYWRELVKRHGIGEPLARRLAGRYGTEASTVLRLVKERAEWGEALVEGFDAIRAEVVHAAREEMAATVEDALARRLGLELWDWRLAKKAAPVAARLMALDSEKEDGYAARVEGLMEAAGLRTD